jgi:hypothetical protein
VVPTPTVQLPETMALGVQKMMLVLSLLLVARNLGAVVMLEVAAGRGLASHGTILKNEICGNAIVEGMRQNDGKDDER